MYTSVVVVVLLAVSLPYGFTDDKYPDKDGAHSITQGTRKMVSNKPVDIHLYHESIKTDRKWFPIPSGQSRDICYPNKKNHQAKFTITSYTISDVGMKGLAYLKKDGGGIGKNKVCFHVKSQRGKGYHFNIDVYGTYKD